MVEHKPSGRVEFDTCDNCLKSSADSDGESTAAMVSQAEVWQEDKKFTVCITVFQLQLLST